jgi:hypothetical protein
MRKVLAVEKTVDGRSKAARKLRSIGSALAAALLRADNAERVVARQHQIILNAKAVMAAKAELARDETGQLDNVAALVAAQEDRLELDISIVTEEADKRLGIVRK